MTAQANPVVGAIVGEDGKLRPVEGADPSAQWTYREPPAEVSTVESPSE